MPQNKCRDWISSQNLHGSTQTHTHLQTPPYRCHWPTVASGPYSPLVPLLLGNYHLGYTLHLRLYQCQPYHFGFHGNPAPSNGAVRLRRDKWCASICVCVWVYTFDCVVCVCLFPLRVRDIPSRCSEPCENNKNADRRKQHLWRKMWVMGGYVTLRILCVCAFNHYHAHTWYKLKKLPGYNVE